MYLSCKIFTFLSTVSTFFYLHPWYFMHRLSHIYCILSIVAYHTEKYEAEFKSENEVVFVYDRCHGLLMLMRH